MKRLFLGAVLFVAAIPAFAVYTAEAALNATIQQSGPRSGPNGLAFFNIEGEGVAAQFRSWGAADFNAADFGVSGTVTDISNFQVVLTQANAAFSVTGQVQFWLSADTTTSIAQGVSTLVWMDGVDPDGVGNQLPLVFLGDGTYTVVSTGTVDTYSFNLSAAAEQLIIDALNTNGKIRLVVTPEDDAPNPANVTATWAGYTNTTLTGPTLSFDASTGPASVMLTNVAAIQGQLLGGNLASIQASDNVRFEILCDEFDSTGEVRITGTSPMGSPTQINGTFEARAGRTDLSQFVKVFNFSTNGWDSVDFRNSSLTDVTFNSTIAGANHVSGSNEIRIQFLWIPQGDIDAADGWSMGIDLVQLTVQ